LKAIRCVSAAAAALATVTSLAVSPLSADEASEQRAGPRSIWDGVITEVQAIRGELAYTGPCSHCHGFRLNGAPDDPDMAPTPPLAGAKFLRDWDGRSLAQLYEYTRTTMPENNPSYLSPQEFVDVIAYMLVKSGVPTGDGGLEPDTRLLAEIIIKQRS
jgi:mono/diheme cytochrome c family protein